MVDLVPLSILERPSLKYYADILYPPSILPDINLLLHRNVLRRQYLGTVGGEGELSLSLAHKRMEVGQMQKKHRMLK